MKKFFVLTSIILCAGNYYLFSQPRDVAYLDPIRNFIFIPKNHDPNYLKLNKIPAKSFYQSKSDWQRIIDSTWGPGDPLSKKLEIFNTYAQAVHDEFDGFHTLNINWDSLYNYYLENITDSTSKGAFSSLMSHFAYTFQDRHTWALDSSVIAKTPLNPGVPILLMGSFISVAHFGAVTTLLPDSNTLVLRVVPNHPLNIEPGDIILGYEGIPWKVLVWELFDAGLPVRATTGGCQSAHTYSNLMGVGLNWHLFNTIDILKYSSGDTLHLSVLPLLGLDLPPMLNNEQLSIPNIPFPDLFSLQAVTYGTLPGTNIGFIYLGMEVYADLPFYEAVKALKNTDALIIDMRMDRGGMDLFPEAFAFLSNEYHKTIEGAYRCNKNTFDLCPHSDGTKHQIKGSGPDHYDRPIAVLLGPSCVSKGDCTAYRLRYLPIIKFFGKSTNASFGSNVFIERFPDWGMRYSVEDKFEIYKPGIYLNRTEYPIDYPVWHTPEDVANGNDVVVNKALEWINYLVYPHNSVTNSLCYSPGEDSVQFSTIIENPNLHQIAARAHLKTLDDTVLDSLDLTKQMIESNQIWTGSFKTPQEEDFYKISITTFDHTESASLTISNATRFTTSGTVVIDSISIRKQFAIWKITPFFYNSSKTLTIPKVEYRLSCDDPWILSFEHEFSTLSDIPPHSSVSPSKEITIRCIDSLFPGYFNFKAEISSDGWTYWIDSLKVILTDIEDEKISPISFKLEQNFPNPFNPSTRISWQSPVHSWQTLKVFDLLGREVKTLVNEEREAGYYTIEFNASELPSGVYFYQLKTVNPESSSGQVLINTKKMLLLK